jgi:hypothetical protein
MPSLSMKHLEGMDQTGKDPASIKSSGSFCTKPLVAFSQLCLHIVGDIGCHWYVEQVLGISLLQLEWSPIYELLCNFR